MVEIDLVIDVPIAPNFDAAVLHYQHLSGQESLDAAEKRLPTDGVLECQVFCEGAASVSIEGRNGTNALASEAKYSLSR